ncbi:DUF885 domain-containing protein [Elongatibacter sediminis]|uniref:DUF885 domain-containing protein n=1 Tax=Elongatibacter sediminis TaxID=3119006 RepID=A0AAW9R9K5_9GAMM
MSASIRVLSCLALFTCSFSALAGEAWVEESNAITAEVMRAQAQFAPETFSSLGVESVDGEIMDLRAETYERSQQQLLDLIAMLEQRATTVEHPKAAQDVQILIGSLRDQHRSTELQRRHMLTYYNLPQTLYFGFRALLDPRNNPERYPAALERLSKYTGRADGFEPLTRLARDRTAERLADPGLLGPFRLEIENNLENVPRFLAGMESTFAESGLEGWEDDLALLSEQLTGYAEWLRTNVLPRARDDHRLPEEIYADNLANFGVDLAPRDLIQAAQLGFADLQRQMQSIARLIAAERGWPSADYRDVIRELNRDQVPEEDVLAVYRNRLAELEAIILEHDIVTLPDRPAAIRLATEAESAASPAPFMSPPQLTGDTGQPGEFVLVTSNPTDESGEAMDDFGSLASTWSLAAHEARPGHEMQFAAMLEAGVSEARALYAFNSANVEGWGLYAEAIMLEYLPLDAQLFGLRSRLMRAARAFLDPMLNLGLLEPDQALEFLVDDVVLSRPMARQEVDRYTYRAPGQATSYYVGYMSLMALRTEVELRLRDRFDQRAFHDFLLSQGLLPPELLRQAVLEEFVPAQ